MQVAVQGAANPEMIEETIPAERKESVVKKEWVPFERKVVEDLEE